MNNLPDLDQERPSGTKYGPYGGQFVPETLKPALDSLEATYMAMRNSHDFLGELDHLLRTYVGRPTPLTYAARLSQHREHVADLCAFRLRLQTVEQGGHFFEQHVVATGPHDVRPVVARNDGVEVDPRMLQQLGLARAFQNGLALCGSS